MVGEDSKTIKSGGRACDSNLLVHNGNDDTKDNLGGDHQYEEQRVLQQHATTHRPVIVYNTEHLSDRRVCGQADSHLVSSSLVTFGFSYYLLLTPRLA